MQVSSREWQGDARAKSICSQSSKIERGQLPLDNGVDETDRSDYPHGSWTDEPFFKALWQAQPP